MQDILTPLPAVPSHLLCHQSLVVVAIAKFANQPAFLEGFLATSYNKNIPYNASHQIEQTVATKLRSTNFDRSYHVTPQIVSIFFLFNYLVHEWDGCKSQLASGSPVKYFFNCLAVLICKGVTGGNFLH